MKQDFNFDSLTDEELDMLIKMQEEKVKNLREKLKNELNNLKELMKELEDKKED